MQLVLLRHAQPQWLSPEGTGVSDPGLSPLGWEKARELQSSLGHESFTSVQVSTYRRAQETARGVLGSREHGWESRDWLREITLPDLSKQPAEVVATFFQRMKRRNLEEWWEGFPEGESFRDFHQRVQQGLSYWLESLGVRRLKGDLFKIDDQTLGSKHLIVSHLGTTGLILSELLHIELVPWLWDSLALDWNGVVRLETAPIADGHIFCLRSFNEGGHRDPSLGYRLEAED